MHDVYLMAGDGHAWPQNLTPTTYFTVSAGCSLDNALWQAVVSTLPVMPQAISDCSAPLGAYSACIGTCDCTADSSAAGDPVVPGPSALAGLSACADHVASPTTTPLASPIDRTRVMGTPASQGAAGPLRWCFQVAAP